MFFYRQRAAMNLVLRYQINLRNYDTSCSHNFEINTASASFPSFSDSTTPSSLTAAHSSISSLSQNQNVNNKNTCPNQLIYMFFYRQREAMYLVLRHQIRLRNYNTACSHNFDINAALAFLSSFSDSTTSSFLTTTNSSTSFHSQN